MKNRFNDRVLTNPKTNKRIWVDAPFIIEPGVKILLCDIWQSPRYVVESYDEDLEDLVSKAAVLRYIPTQFDAEPPSIARILSGEDEKWRVYCVDFTEKPGMIFFGVVSKCDINPAWESYYLIRIGLNFRSLPSVAIKIRKDDAGGAIHEVCYKQAPKDEIDNKRVVLTSWKPEVGFEMLKVYLTDTGELKPRGAKVAKFLPSRLYKGVDLNLL